MTITQEKGEKQVEELSDRIPVTFNSRNLQPNGLLNYKFACKTNLEILKSLISNHNLLQHTKDQSNHY